MIRETDASVEQLGRLIERRDTEISRLKSGLRWIRQACFVHVWTQAVTPDDVKDIADFAHAVIAEELDPPIMGLDDSWDKSLARAKESANRLKEIVK